jgi:hypothetical protein
MFGFLHLSVLKEGSTVAAWNTVSSLLSIQTERIILVFVKCLHASLQLLHRDLNKARPK